MRKEIVEVCCSCGGPMSVPARTRSRASARLGYVIRPLTSRVGGGSGESLPPGSRHPGATAPSYGLGQLDLPGASEEIVDQAATQTMACTEDETQAEAADCIGQESSEYPSSCPVAGLAVR